MSKKTPGLPSEHVRERVKVILEQASLLLCDFKDSVEIEARPAGNSLIWVIKSTNPGLVIGRDGSTVNALRVIINKIGASVDQRFGVEVERLELKLEN